MKFDLSLILLKLRAILGPKLSSPGVLFLSFRIQHEAGQPGLYKVSTIIDSQCLPFIIVVHKRAHRRHKYSSFRRSSLVQYWDFWRHITDVTTKQNYSFACGFV
jgi:hypothetical protein